MSSDEEVKQTILVAFLFAGASFFALAISFVARFFFDASEHALQGGLLFAAITGFLAYVFFMAWHFIRTTPSTMSTGMPDNSDVSRRIRGFGFWVILGAIATTVGAVVSVLRLLTEY